MLAVVRLKYPGNYHEPLRRLLAERGEILECLRTTGDDCYTLKVAATSMAHLETLVDELAGFGSTTTSVVYSQTLPYRGAGLPLCRSLSARGRNSAPGRAPSVAPRRVTDRISTAITVQADNGSRLGWSRRCLQDSPAASSSLPGTRPTRAP